MQKEFDGKIDSNDNLVYFGFSFLSGLPEPQRSKRIIMPIQAYVDESGGKGTTKLFTMAGLIADTSDWLDLSIEWEQCLKREPVIPVFKMRQAAGLSGPFRRLSSDARDEKLRELARIVNRHVNCSVFATYDIAAYADIVVPTTKKPFNSTYFAAYQSILFASCFELWDAGLREPFEIIFDEEVILGPRARMWYPVLKEGFRAMYPDEAVIIPTDPVFRDDKSFMPLQVADLYAYCVRDANENESSRFDWLLKELTSVPNSKHSHFYDRERLQKVSNEAKNFPGKNTVRMMVEIYNEMYGD